MMLKLLLNAGAQINPSLRSEQIQDITLRLVTASARMEAMYPLQEAIAKIDYDMIMYLLDLRALLNHPQLPALPVAAVQGDLELC